MPYVGPWKMRAAGGGGGLKKHTGPRRVSWVECRALLQRRLLHLDQFEAFGQGHVQPGRPPRGDLANGLVDQGVGATSFVCEATHVGDGWTYGQFPRSGTWLHVPIYEGPRSSEQTQHYSSTWRLDGGGEVFRVGGKGFQMRGPKQKRPETKGPGCSAPDEVKTAILAWVTA